MKKSILLLFLSFIIHNADSQVVKLKRYTQKTDNKTIIRQIEEFDKNGNLIKDTECLNDSCSKTDVLVQIFNNDNLKIADSAYTNQYGYHQLIVRRRYNYTKNQKLKTEKDVNKECNEGFNELKTFYYGNNDRLIKVTNKFACNDKHYFDYPIFYQYDSIGNKTSRYAKYRDTTIIFFRNQYEYDVNKNLVSDTYFYNKNDSLEFSSKKVFRYDSLNRKIKQIKIYSESNVDSVSYSYHDNGLLKSVVKHPKYSDEYLTWTEFEYNSLKRLNAKQNYWLTKKGKKRKGRRTTIEYEFY